jgi:hypothetical protein
MGLSEQQKFNKRRLLAQIHLKQNRPSAAAEIAAAMLETNLGHENTMCAGCLLAQSGKIALAERCFVSELPDWPIYEHWRRILKGEIMLAQGNALGALSMFLDAPPPKLKNQWPEYIVRAAMRGNNMKTAGRYVTALFRNPGGYWIQADSAGPGFFSWAAELTTKLDLPELEAARAQTLRKSLANA